MSIWLIEYRHEGGVWLVNRGRGVFESAVAAEACCNFLRIKHPGTKFRGAEYVPAVKATV
jgi:hypothetical protein